MTDLHEHWSKVRTQLLGAMTEIGAALPPKVTTSVTEWLENNELELALRAIQEGAEEHDVQVSSKAMHHLKQAAYLMRLDL